MKSKYLSPSQVKKALLQGKTVEGSWTHKNCCGKKVKSRVFFYPGEFPTEFHKLVKYRIL